MYPPGIASRHASITECAAAIRACGGDPSGSRLVYWTGNEPDWGLCFDGWSFVGHCALCDHIWIQQRTGTWSQLKPLVTQLLETRHPVYWIDHT